MTGEGYRVTQSNISRMEYAVTHLFLTYLRCSIWG
ncbi:hypothetical protein OVX87_03910 [Klebsiella pneumoniae]|nr:hypothetical protein [Klebsiella pneumoniae]